MADIFTPAEFTYRQEAAEVDLGCDDPSGDEATWWHTYALPLLELGIAVEAFEATQAARLERFQVHWQPTP